MRVGRWGGAGGVEEDQMGWSGKAAVGRWPSNGAMRVRISILGTRIPGRESTCPVSEAGKSQLGQEWAGRHKSTPRRGTEATVTPRMRERQGGVRDEEREHLKGSGS